MNWCANYRGFDGGRFTYESPTASESVLHVFSPLLSTRESVPEQSDQKLAGTSKAEKERGRTDLQAVLRTFWFARLDDLAFLCEFDQLTGLHGVVISIHRRSDKSF